MTDKKTWQIIPGRPGRPETYRLETLVGTVKVYNSNPIRITYSGLECVDFEECRGLTLEEAKDFALQWMQIICLLSLREIEETRAV